MMDKKNELAILKEEKNDGYPHYSSLSIILIIFPSGATQIERLESYSKKCFSLAETPALLKKSFVI